jgi:hypothetical protein
MGVSRALLLAASQSVLARPGEPRFVRRAFRASCQANRWTMRLGCAWTGKIWYGHTSKENILDAKEANEVAEHHSQVLAKIKRRTWRLRFR